MLAISTLPAMPRQKPSEDVKKHNAGTRLTDAAMTELEQIAMAEDRTISYLIERAVREYLDNRRKAKHKSK